MTAVVLGYNHAPFVESTLRSVAAQQRLPDQVIVMDDASDDGTAEIAQTWIADNQPGWTFISHSENRGICASLNEALALATGDLIAIVAMDDLWAKNRVLSHVRALEAAPAEVVAVYSDVRRI